MRRPPLIRATLHIMMALTVVGSGCNLGQPLQDHQIGELGRFSFRYPDERMKGIILVAPHGIVEPDSADYAKWISERTGAGIVIGYGFGAKRLSVARPLIGTPYPPSARRASVYTEFKELLQRTAQGKIAFYIGVRFAQTALDRIEVTTSGLTFEQIKVFKEKFFHITDGALARSALPKISMAIQPLDKISFRSSGIKHHGVLMIAEKGMNLRLPKLLSSLDVKTEYRQILASWLSYVLTAVEHNPGRLPQSEVKLMTHGRIELIPSRGAHRGVVIGAPHGSFDEHTAEIVEQISYQTGLPAVIAKGFTPTECGGWRINVNRPTETRYPAGEFELGSERAQDVYRTFKGSVLQAAGKDLNLYIDIHQNGRQSNLEVATVGISKEEAMVIKNTYREIRDRALRLSPAVTSVELTIEPVDAIEIGAWNTKAKGILSVAERSLHFELPLYDMLRSSKSRETYTEILATLLSRIVPLLLKTRDLTSSVTLAPGRAGAPE